MQRLRDAHPDRPVLDLALSHALLQRVARDGVEPALRVYRPGPTLAFGRLDALREGFAAACAAARAHGYEPVVRHAGGHAAAYDGECLVYEEITRSAEVAGGLQPRFRAATALIAGALAGLGADVRVGALPGEYCPGEHSVNAGGRIKVAGLAQRMVRGGALVSAVVVAGGGARVRAVLVDVYRELGLPWDPATAGALQDVAPQVTVEAVERALLEAAAGAWPLHDGVVDDATLALAAALEARHRVA